MAVSRYQNISKLAGGRRYATSRVNTRIRNAVERGDIVCREHVLKSGERIDIIAGVEYGNSQLYWIIAAASGIGWGLQAPPGTRILIPTSIEQVSRYL